MKILIVRTDPSILNIKNYNSQEIGLAKAFIKQGNECDIIYFNGRNPTKTEIIDTNYGKNITIYWLKGFSLFNNGFFPGISKIVEKYDVIQVSEYYFFASWYLCRKFRKYKKVYIYQGVYDSDNSLKFKIRCKIMDPILLTKSYKVTNVFTKSVLAEKTMMARGFKNILTVGVGLDYDRFKRKSIEKNELFIKENNIKYLLYIGVLEDRRNILFMLDVLKDLLNKGQNIKLVIIGRGNANYTEACMKKINDLGVQKFIIYKDKLPQEKISSIYKDCDLFLLPSKYEIFGMVILESCYFNLPIISSENGGALTLKDEYNGIFTVKDFSVDDWSNAIVYALNTDVQCNYSKEKKYTWDNIAHKILNNLG